MTHVGAVLNHRVWQLAALVSACSVLAGCSPALDWREVLAPAGGLQGLFPCKPTMQTRSAPLPDPAASSLSVTLQACEADGSTFALLSAQVPEGVSPSTVLQSMTDGLGARYGSAPQAVTPAVVSGMTASPQSQRMRFSAARPDGTAIVTEALFFSRGSVVYQATLTGPRPSAEAADTYFGAWAFKP